MSQESLIERLRDLARDISERGSPGWVRQMQLVVEACERIKELEEATVADSADGVVESLPVKMNDQHIGTLRKGSTVAYWSPAGVVVGIIETNPEHPPRVHYFDGRGTVELDDAATRSENEHMGETGQL